MSAVKDLKTRTLYNPKDYLKYFLENQDNSADIFNKNFENDVFVTKEPNSGTYESCFETIAKPKRKRRKLASKKKTNNKENRSKGLKTSKKVNSIVPIKRCPLSTLQADKLPSGSILKKNTKPLNSIESKLMQGYSTSGKNDIIYEDPSKNFNVVVTTAVVHFTDASTPPKSS